jgi:hypothetical protein
MDVIRDCSATRCRGAKECKSRGGYPNGVPTLTDRAIIDIFRDLFDLSEDVTASAMGFGFQFAGIGWLPIMERLCERLVPLAQDTPLQLISVKSKLGSLRLAYRGGSEAIDAEIDAEIAAAKSLALVTCELCGGPGVQRTFGG